MEIKERVSGDKTYNNIELRTIPYGNTEEILYNTSAQPLSYDTKFGKSYMFFAVYGNKEVSFFVSEKDKTDDFNTPLYAKLKEFNKGDVLAICKKEGKSKAGRFFRYYEVNKVGEGKVPEMPQAKPRMPNLNVTKPNFVVPENKEEFKLSDWEAQVYAGVKDLPDLNKEQRVQLFVQNEVPYARATTIVENLFK